MFNRQQLTFLTAAMAYSYKTSFQSVGKNKINFIFMRTQEATDGQPTDVHEGSVRKFG